ncbi:hypothetical protein BGX33_004272 [Mortierella sp. NVP41]|nr:hypothetical protein BGX33_004272 [Mortierella sp. NVP41]
MQLDPGNTNGGGGGGKDKSSKFPAWIGGIIAIVVVFGAAIIFGLVRRKKKMAADKEKKTMKKKRRSARSQAAATERRRSMSLPLHSHHHHQQQHDQEQQYHQDEEDDKESEYVYQLHSAEPSLAISEKQDLSATGGRQEGGGGFGSWFRRSRTEDPMDRELGETTSRTTRSSPSSVRSSLSEDVQRLATNHSSALSLDMKEVEAIHQSHLQHPTDYSAGSPPGGYTVPLNTSGAAAAVSGEAAAGSIHSDSTTAVVLDSTGPRSRLSVNIPGIFTTPSDSAAAAAAAAASVAASSSAQGAFTEDDEKDVASELSYSKNLNNRPSFSSATSSSEGGFSSPPSDRFRRSSSTHAFLTAIPSPGSPISPISPISPRPPLSSGSSSRSSQRQSMQTPARRT